MNQTESSGYYKYLICLPPPSPRETINFKSDMMFIIWQFVYLNILTVLIANNSTDTTEIQLKLFNQHFVRPKSYKLNTCMPPFK